MLVNIFSWFQSFDFSDVVFRIPFELGEQCGWSVLTIATNNRNPKAEVFGPIEEMKGTVGGCYW